MHPVLPGNNKHKQRSEMQQSLDAILYEHEVMMSFSPADISSGQRLTAPSFLVHVRWHFRDDEFSAG